MQLQYYSHASLQLTSKGGKRLLTDPWLYNPVYGNMMWQFPACNIPLDQYIDQDALYISHTHPDHYCLRTLAHFSRDIPIVIRKYGPSIIMKNEIEQLGFKTIYQLEHREILNLFDFSIQLFADFKNTDSVIVASDGEHTLFNQNDCFLPEDELKWIGENHKLDVACLFYMGVGPYPGSFDLSEQEKLNEIEAKKKECFDRALNTAKLLQAGSVIPVASDMTWLRRPDLARLNGALPVEFHEYAKKLNANVEILLMMPGERYHFTETSNDFSNYFSSVEEKDKAWQSFLEAPENQRLIAKLEENEQRHRFNPEHFLTSFNRYCSYEASLKPEELVYQRPEKPIQIGLRVQNTEAEPQEFVFFYEAFNTKVQRAEQPLAEMQNLHMILNIEHYLLGMALSLACRFEDLVNCRYFIERPGPFTPEEDSFWEFLSSFSFYLETKSPEAKESRKEFRALPPSMQYASPSVETTI